MKVTLEKTENSQAYLTIEMEPAEVEESLDKSYRRLVQKANIPGFRKGKAPRAVLERHVGKANLMEEALNILLPEAYEKAIKEQKLEPVDRPQVEVATLEPVVFKAVVPLLPTIKLGDYHNLRLTPEPIEFKEKDVEDVIERLRHHHAIWVPVERQVNSSDLVNMDVESQAGDKPFLNQKGVQYQVLKDKATPVAGFAEQIIGMKIGETKEFKLQFPGDYHEADFAGKEVTFKVKINEIKQERLSELNDEFAKQVDPQCGSLDALREKVREDLKRRAEEETKKRFEQKVVDAVVNVSEVEYPPIMIEREIDELIREQLEYWRMGPERLPEYLKLINKTLEQLREELRPVAIKRFTQSMVLGRLSREEKIEASDDEINEEIKKIVEATAEENKEEMNKFLSRPQGREPLKLALIKRKTIQRLAEIARSPETEVAPSPETKETKVEPEKEEPK